MELPQKKLMWGFVYCGWTGLPQGPEAQSAPSETPSEGPFGLKMFFGNTLSITESKQLCFANLLRFSI